MEVTYSQDFPVQGNSDFMRVAWDGLVLNDTGKPFILSQFADRSVQVGGTFGATVESTIEVALYAQLYRKRRRL